MLDEVYATEIDTSNYKSVTISGSRSWHHNIDHSLDHKNLGANESFQLVIFQGGSGETNSVKERNIFAKEVEKIVKKIKEKSGNKSRKSPGQVHAWGSTEIRAWAFRESEAACQDS